MAELKNLIPWDRHCTDLYKTIVHPIDLIIYLFILNVSPILFSWKVFQATHSSSRSINGPCSRLTECMGAVSPSNSKETHLGVFFPSVPTTAGNIAVGKQEWKYTWRWWQWTCKAFLTWMPCVSCTFPTTCSKNKFSGWGSAATGRTFGYLLLKTLGLNKSNSWCQHFLLSCMQYWKQSNPSSTVPLSSPQCESATDFYASATTLFPIPKPAPSKLIVVSVWSPLLWWLSLKK